MTVKRPAIGAEGFVLDHFDQKAIENHLHAVGDRLFTAFEGSPPYAIFSDSLEVYGSDWTGDLLQEFRKRRGYDLTPYLPALVHDIGPKTADIRHDWGKTLTELAEENYLSPLKRVGGATRHPLPFPDLRNSTGDFVQQQPGGFARRGRRSMEKIYADAVGIFGQPSLWKKHHVGRNLDVASFASFSCHAVGYESRS